MVSLLAPLNAGADPVMTYLFKDGGMNDFYDIFCERVEFLCYQSEPNWLGWMIIVMLGIGLLVIILRTFETFTK